MSGNGRKKVQEAARKFQGKGNGVGQMLLAKNNKKER
jgi:hypothetical protein